MSSPQAMNTTPVVLEGVRVRLEPLTMDHLSELAEVAFEPRIWQWMNNDVCDHAGLRAWVDIAIADMQTGNAIAWATRSKADGKIAGSTRLFDVSHQHRTMELGHTWLHPAYQRTGINVEAKYLQLRHAFESMNAIRVAFKTHHKNAQSQAAILALGAKREGIFRNHMIMPDGSARHSVWYSILGEEWAEVKARLEARMRRQFENTTMTIKRQ